jgi:hypothetical protein
MNEKTAIGGRFSPVANQPIKRRNTMKETMLNKREREVVQEILELAKDSNYTPKELAELQSQLTGVMIAAREVR